jgi:hypothetical protein
MKIEYKSATYLSVLTKLCTDILDSQKLPALAGLIRNGTALKCLHTGGSAFDIFCVILEINVSTKILAPSALYLHNGDANPGTMKLAERLQKTQW